MRVVYVVTPDRRGPRSAGKQILKYSTAAFPPSTSIVYLLSAEIIKCDERNSFTTHESESAVVSITMDISQLFPPALFAGPYVLYTTAGVILALVVYLCVYEIIRNRSRIAGFGGPRGLPVVGNLLHVQDYSAQKYQEWAKTCGDVYQVQLGNTTILLINSAAAAKKFFITNSHTFSSRPVTYTFGRVSFLVAG